MEWKKLAPWNWFRKEQEIHGSVVSRTHADTGDPFAAFRSELERVFDDGLRRMGPAFGGVPTLLRPSLDIAESAKAYSISVEIPGVDKADVTVSVEGDTLVIRGEKRSESEEHDESYHCIERSFGTFQRMLSLPDDADPEAIEAKFKRGVLKIRIAKRPASVRGGRSIEIHHE